MKLTKLGIHHLPGIREPFSLTNLETVNLIHGPNGSGKSSLTRAIHKLLWKNLPANSPFSVEAVFQDGSNSWRVGREAKEDPKWTLGGETKAPPTVPSGLVAECYKMGVLDLVLPADGPVEQELASRINIEMYGGIDLEQVKEDLFPIRPKLANDPGKKLDEALAKYENLRATQARLSLAQIRLPQLVQEFERKNKASKKLDLLKNFQNREMIKSDLLAAKATLAGFLPGQKNVLQKDADDLALWLKNHQENEKEIRALERETMARQQEIDSLAFPEVAPNSVDPAYLATLVENAANIQARIGSLEEEIITLETTLASLLQDLDLEEICKDSEIVSGDALYRDMSGKYALLAQNLAQIDGWETVRSKLNLADSHESRDHASITEGLRRWLEIQTTKNTFNHRFIVAVGLLVAPLAYWLLPLLFPAVALVLVGAILWWKKSRHIKQLTQDVTKQLQEAGLEITGELTFRLATELLVQSSQASGVGQSRQKLSELLDDQLQSLSDESADYESQIQTLKDRFGSTLSAAHITFLRLLDTVPVFRQARQELASHQELINELKRKLEKELAIISDAFTAFGLDSISDTSQAKHRLKVLGTRQIQWTKLESQQPVAQTKLNNLLADQTRIENNFGSLWSRLEIEPQQDTHLVTSMVEQISSWNETQNQVIQLQTRFDTENEAFGSDPDLLSANEVENLPPHELDFLMAELSDDQRTRDDDLKEIQTIKNSLNEALQSSDIAEAQANCERAKTILGDVRTKEQEAQLGQLLLTDIGDAYHRNSKPKILATASTNFSAFTQNKYELRVTAGEDHRGRFFAYDTDTGNSLALAELSDGTRAQLLLAVRLAFIAENEGDSHPPIFLDESLTASDPVRFAAIASNLSHWAHDHDRQVFYLTSNPGDAEAWKIAMENSGLPQPRIFDLALERGLQTGLATGSSTGTPLVLPEPPPSPKNMSDLEYAHCLNVPQFDGWKTHTETHLWHLLFDNLPLLHRLLLVHTKTFGRWDSLKQVMPSLAGMSVEDVKNLEARGRCLEMFFHHWRLGRGKILTGTSLLDSTHVSKKYLQPCRTLLSQMNGDAERFIAALRAKKISGFRQEKIRLLEEFFEQDGYLDRREQLSQDDLVANISAAVVPEINNGHLTVPEVRKLVLTWHQSLLAIKKAQ